MHLISEFYQSKLTETDWQFLQQNVRTSILKPALQLVDMRWPGFIFYNSEAQKIFETQLAKDLEVRTPPRGALHPQNRWIFCGIKPGSYRAEDSMIESAWFFGPSSKTLHQLLLSQRIVPYFTNVYKSYLQESNHDVSGIHKELRTIAFIYQKIYGISELKLVCMGNYLEYSKLQKVLDNDYKLNKIGFKYHIIKIWHPAYVARNGVEQTLAAWIQQLKTSKSI